MRFVALVLTILMCGILGAGPASAEVTVNLQVAAEGLTAPLNMISPPDGTKRRFITEQIGVIKILLPDGKMVDEPFLNIRHRIPKLHQDFDERGLLGLAFHPDYKTNGRFFVAYSGYLPGDSTLDKVVWYSHTNYVAEYQVSKYEPQQGRPAERADPDQDRLAAVQPQRPLDRLRAGRVPLHLHGRRRLRERLGHRPQRHEGERPGPGLAPRQDPPDRREQDGREQGRVLRRPG